MQRLCQGKKRCLGVVLQEADSQETQIYEPFAMRYSRPIIWVFVKKVKEGLIIHLHCKNVTSPSWVFYDNLALHQERKYRKRNMEDEIFLHCFKPMPGDGITAAYFHLPPLVNLDPATGEKVNVKYARFSHFSHRMINFN